MHRRTLLAGALVTAALATVRAQKPSLRRIALLRGPSGPGTLNLKAGRVRGVVLPVWLSSRAEIA